MSSPKVLHLSTYDAHGGAARAAIAIHNSLESAAVDSRIRIAKADDLRFKLAKEADRRLWRLQKSNVLTWRSPARFGSISAKEINNSGADIVHMHWVTDGFLTIESIGQIKKPIVWSLCDAWAFSGAEHYATQFSRTRSVLGYLPSNRNPNDSGFDLDRWTWNRKKSKWTTPMHVLPASTWLTQAAQESALMGHWPITQIPHIVDTNLFTSTNDRRKNVGQPVILFLASAGIRDTRKGADLLIQALKDPAMTQRLKVIIVGPRPTAQEEQHISSSLNHDLVFHGEARGDKELIDLYLQADVTVVPSREDNMPIAAMESQSCGTPVVAFRIGGLGDIVNPTTSGYLAEPENTHDLAQGIVQVLNSNLRESTRQHAKATWSPEVIVPQLLAVYESALT
ncbi:MAG: glycosyltransferase [Candidatus Nanopelagicales bacterium]|nr:glycosyltransferase [Candidatus Nanopelagicales bacterium]